MIKSKYDVLIVGGGTGGATIGKFLTQRGLDVVILEKSKEKDLHKICGDATSEIHFKRVNSLDPDKKNKIDLPKVGDEIHQVVKGYTFYSPNGNNYKITSDGDSWIIAREKFTLRLLEEARNSGVDFYDRTTVRKPLVEKNQVVGVNLRTKNKELKDIRAKVVVDASGMAGIIRRNLDENKTRMDKIIKHYDLASAYRELVQFAEDNPISNPEYIRMYFDTTNCPGGYFWIFPRSSYSANVGLGIEPRRLKGGPKKSYYWWINQLPEIFRDTKVLHSGGATVPLRRPIDVLVYNGLALIGDAGACVKATDGGGIGLSMISASIATKPIIQAIEEDNLKREGPLWNYNIGYMRSMGMKEAPLAIGKSYIVTATNFILNTLFEKEVIDAQDLYNLNAGNTIDMSLKTKIKRGWRGRSILRFLLGLSSTMKRMNKAQKMYENYPDNWKDFLIWREKISELYQDEKRATQFYEETGKP
ncbi:MAG: geranylgeranyl reductase family protein [Candidatus Hodarchaeales archaeon]|jgi:geranylgeranyl reductase family protein